MGKAPTYAARKAKGMKRLEIWVTERHVEKLDAACAEDGCGRSEMIAALIIAYQDEPPNEEPK